MRTWLSLFIVITACNCHEDKGAPVSPRPAPVVRDTAPKTLSIDDYEAAVYTAGPSATFRPTTPAEHEAVAKLVPALLEASWGSANPPHERAAAAGFQIEAWTINGDRYWALVEAPGHERGAGAYIFRVGPKNPDEPTLLLQAPHNFFDLGTGRLAADIMFNPRKGLRPRALFTNTIHRYQITPGDKKKRKGDNNPADVAHNPEHAFTVATDAFAIAAGHVRVIQLHGFGERVDEPEGDPGAIAMVVSAGDKAKSSPLSIAIAAAAAKAFGDVRRFPEETKLLGATTNAQKRALDKSGRGDFVHIEMSRELRQRLAASAELRTQLADVLFDSNPETP